MSETTFFSEVWRRRVPQILGFYVAATWMAVEIGDWMIERFALPANLTSYVFIGMVTLLPAVAVVAWTHGAPGKDRWTRFQAAFASLNVLAAAAAIWFWAQPDVGQQAPQIAPLASEAATQTVEIVSEDGTVETHEVAKDGFHQALIAFFWKNTTGDPELDWLSYGGPWLLSEDLLRNPLISVMTPLGVASIASRLQEKGFETGVGEPLSLDLQMARERGLSRILTGEFARLADGALEFTARLIEVETGQMINEWKRSGADWLNSTDLLAGDIRQELLKNVNTNNIVTELSIAEHTSDNPEAIREVVEALRLRTFENDYVAGIAALDRAVAADPTIATAHVMAHLYYRAMGDFQSAVRSANKALEHDYKLYSETKYMLKANLEAVQGRAEQAVRMLERWAEIHPQSTQAHGLLGNNYVFLRELDKAQASFQRLLELDPSQRKTLLALAKVMRLKGELPSAVELIEKYIEEVKPENAEALMDLGNTHIQAGDLEKAREAFEEAAFLDATNPRARIALAGLLLRGGRYQEALSALDAIGAENLPDRQAFDVYNAKQMVYLQTGQVSQALETLAIQEQISASFMPPVMQVFQIGVQKVAHQSNLGNRDGAIAEAERIQEVLKPPFDGYSKFALLEVHEAFEDNEAYLKEMEYLEEFVSRFPNPGMKPFLDPYRARALAKSGEPEKAAKMIADGRAEMSKSIAVLEQPLVLEVNQLLEATFLRKAGKLDEGLAVIDEVRKTNPGMALALLERAHLLTEKGEFGAAKEDISKLELIWAEADPEYLYLKKLQKLNARLAEA